MAVALTLSYVSGNTNGRIGIDTIKGAVTGGTSGAWYDWTCARPDGVTGGRIQSAADGTASIFLVPQMIGAYIFQLWPTGWTTGTVPNPGLPMASINTTGFNVAAVTPDVGMSFPTATVGATTLAAANVSG